MSLQASILFRFAIRCDFVISVCVSKQFFFLYPTLTFIYRQMSFVAHDNSEITSSQLTGIIAERGAFVTCRDAPAIEMLIRLNKMYTQPSITAIFAEASEMNANTESHGINGEQNLFVKHLKNNSHVLQKMFVVQPDRMEHDIQKWLNPYKRTDVEQSKCKRYRSE